MKEQNVTVSHADDHEFQLATLVVQTASSFQSRVQIRIGNKNVNAKSIMGMTYLALMDDDVVTVSVNGPDEDAAMDALADILEG